VPSKHNVVDCFADILENIERIQAYLMGLERDGFERDGRTRDAVERCLERLCEAAVRLGDQAEIHLPGQPWRDIRGMGNQLRHAYDRVSVDVVWNAVRYDIPSLANDVRSLLVKLTNQNK
jgi:uncharacterized protein with HEPN domain